MNKRFKNLHTGEMMEVPNIRVFYLHCKDMAAWHKHKDKWMADMNLNPGDKVSVHLDYIHPDPNAYIVSIL